MRTGHVTTDEALEQLRRLPFEEIEDMARVDHHRSLRAGAPEVVYGENKTAQQIAAIMSSLAAGGGGALATRVEADKGREVLRQLGQGRQVEEARIVIIDAETPPQRGRGPVAVVSAGTSDQPVAREAAVTAEFLGHEVRYFADVGVAGLQRTLAVVDRVRECSVAIVVAGMEGALPTVLASLVDRPIIAVPTSIGYGVGVGGYVAMMGMLVACAPGVSVVNIDNGFGAAIAAGRINRRDD